MKHLFLLLLLSGCANVSTLQTARALPKGTGRFLVGFGYYHSPTADEQIGKTGSVANIEFPYVELAARLGIMEGLEAGAKLTLPGYVSVDGKYQFASLGGLAMAGGLGLSYLGLKGASTGTSSRSFDATFLDVLVPAYLSYDFADWLALYVSPKYLFRFANTSTNGSGTAHMAGTTAGVKIGDKGGVFLEGSYLKSLTATAFHQWQVNVAVFFGTAQIFPAATPPP